MKRAGFSTSIWKIAICVSMLLVAMVSILVPTVLAFNENNSEKKPPVEPTVVLDARFDWVPNPAMVNEEVTGMTQIRYQSWVYAVPIR